MDSAKLLGSSGDVGDVGATVMRYRNVRVRRCGTVCLVMTLLLYAVLDYVLYTGHTPCRNLAHFRHEWCGALLTSIIYEHDHTNRTRQVDVIPMRSINDTRWRRKFFTKLGTDVLLKGERRLRKSHFRRCQDVADNDREALNEAKLYQTETKARISPEEYILMTSDCEAFRSAHHYHEAPVSQEEQDFPLAYSILMYKNVDQVEHLLRAIYRPQNYYCIHVDLKADDVTYAAIYAITQCLPHVTVLHPRFDVRWGTFTVIQPDLLCLETLRKYSGWKYFINLTGQEYPLKTNWEIVRILKSLNGANLITGVVGPFHWRTKFIYQNGKKVALGRKAPPPANMTIAKGPNAVAVSRKFADFLLEDKVAQEFINWTKDSYIPDETIFASLSFNPQLGVPGAYTGGPPGGILRSTRLKLWNEDIYYPFWYMFNDECKGVNVRRVCVFGIGDLPKLAHADQLFANKFNLELDSLVLNCMEEILLSRSLQNINGQFHINYTFYHELPYVKHHAATLQ